MNGNQAYREMRKIRSDVKIILSSGYSEQDAVSRFDEDGLSAFVQKPCQIQTLVERIS
jgi:DNA-binding NarL/FixJ family response regulator